MPVIRVAILLALAGLCGCDSGAPESAPRIFDTQRDALDRAHDVQDTVLDAAERRRAAEDEQGR